jgi:stage III sporulation protein AD
MSVYQIIAVAVLGAVLALTIRPFRPEMALLVGICTGLIILFYAVAELSGLMDAITSLADQYGIERGYIGVLLKIIGIAYAAQFGAQICADAGETAIGGKVELCGRILILAAAMPATIMTLTSAVNLLKDLS